MAQIDKSTLRLFYLANELRSPLPNSLVRFIPQGDLLQGLAAYGLTGAQVGKKLSRPQLENLIKQGGIEGKATIGEWRYLVSSIVTEALIDQKETMELPEFMKKMDLLSRWQNGGSSIIATEEGDFSDDGEDIVKWDTGFEPFDSVMQGFYQGVFIIMGGPGIGKTSHMLSLVEAIKKNEVADEVWFYQTEIPQAMFKYRMKPILQRGKKYFKKGKDRVFYGQQSLTDIIETVKSDPNSDRIIFHDGPDVLAAGGEADGRRFELESIFRDLVILKGLCKAIFVSSQVRKKDVKHIQLGSAAESWAKAWYADAILGVQKMGSKGLQALMKTNVVKNRFGPVDNEIKYNYHQIQLIGEVTGEVRQAGWSSDEDSGEEDY
jgi:hypothetical protein